MENSSCVAQRWRISNTRMASMSHRWWHIGIWKNMHTEKSQYLLSIHSIYVLEFSFFFNFCEGKGGGARGRGYEQCLKFLRSFLKFIFS